jgi:uncharacterized membrane-anchored protein
MYGFRRLALLAAAALFALPAFAADDEDAEQGDQQSDVKWIEGPKKVQLGKVAVLDLPASCAFADKEDAQKLLEKMGNVIGGTELGLVVPKAEDQDWIIVFDYDDVGYVKDDDKAEIDADEILKNIKEGTEEANAERKKRGFAAMHVTGWAEPPHYDTKTHNVRLLGREGVMSVTLVEDPDKLARSKPAVDEVIKAFSFQQGKTYAEWKSGDKVAEYGLAGLVAAGAGAAAVKLGFFGVLGKLLAKMGKALVFVFAAIAGAIAKFWRSLKAKLTGRNTVAENRSSGPDIGGGSGGSGGPGGAPPGGGAAGGSGEAGFGA